MCKLLGCQDLYTGPCMRRGVSCKKLSSGRVPKLLFIAHVLQLKERALLAALSCSCDALHACRYEGPFRPSRQRKQWGPSLWVRLGQGQGQGKRQHHQLVQVVALLRGLQRRLALLLGQQAGELAHRHLLCLRLSPSLVKEGKAATRRRTGRKNELLLVMA